MAANTGCARIDFKYKPDARSAEKTGALEAINAEARRRHVTYGEIRQEQRKREQEAGAADRQAANLNGRSQTHAVMHHICTRGQITRQEIEREYGVKNVSACIYRIRKHGIDISTEIIPGKGHKNKTVIYRLHRGGDGR